MNEVIQNKKKSEILAEKFAETDYGDVLLHSEISIIIQEPYPSTKYSTTIQKARKILLHKYNKSVECIIGDGYRVIYPDDFVKDALKHYKRGFNEMKKGEDKLQNAPVQNMTEEGRIIFRRVYDRVVILNAAVQGATVEIKALAKKPHPFALQGASKWNKRRNLNEHK